MEYVPPPEDTCEEPLRALIFDSYYDPHRGVIVMFKIIDGSLSKGDTVRFMNTKCEYPVVELGVLSPQQLKVSTTSPHSFHIHHHCLQTEKPENF